MRMLGWPRVSKVLQGAIWGKWAYPFQVPVYGVTGVKKVEPFRHVQ